MHFSGKAFLGLFSDSFYVDILSNDLLRALNLTSLSSSNPVTFENLNFEITLSDSPAVSTASTSQVVSTELANNQSDEARTDNSYHDFDLYQYVESLSHTEDDENKDILNNILLYLRYLEKRGNFLRSLQIPCSRTSIPSPSVTEDMESVIEDDQSMTPSQFNQLSQRIAEDFVASYNNNGNNHVTLNDDEDNDSGSWNTVSCDLDAPINRNFENFIDGNETEEIVQLTVPTGSSSIPDRPANNIRTRYLERNSKVYKTYRCKHQLIKPRQRELLDDTIRFFKSTILRQFYSEYLPLFRQLKDQNILRNYRYNFKFDRTRRFGSFYFHVHFTFNQDIDYNTRRNIHNNFLPFFKKVKLMVQNLNSDLRYYGL
jgi:hypothetical protein